MYDFLEFIVNGLIAIIVVTAIVEKITIVVVLQHQQVLDIL